MESKTNILLIFILLLANQLFGQQEKWSLEKCLNYAIKHNLKMKTANYNLQEALLIQREISFQRLPSLNANFDGGIQYGRTIDPTTNEYNNNKIIYSSYTANANIPIYNGNRIYHSLAKAKLDTKIAKINQTIAINEITLSITRAYLEVLLSEEHLSNVKKRVEKSRKQQDLIEKQIQLGVLRKNAKLEFKALVLKNEKTLIEAKNQRLLNYLNLKQLLELDSEIAFQIELPKSNHKSTNSEPDLTLLLKKALSVQPQIMANELQLKSAEKNIAIAKSGYYPTISIFGTLSTRTSSEGKKLESLETVQVSQNGLINGTPVQLELEQTIPNIMDATYSDQIKENFGYGFGVNITIPIYSKHQNKITVEKAKVNLLKTQAIMQQNKQQLKMEIVKAYTDMHVAQKNYEAAQKSLTAVQLAYEDIVSRFELGMASTYELTTAYNDLDIAQFDFSQAKYQLIFYRKVVDFYIGIPITIE